LRQACCHLLSSLPTVWQAFKELSRSLIRDTPRWGRKVAAKMAEVLKVSLDYLVGFADYELDHSLTQKILDIQKLNDEDKTSILKTIDALLRDAKTRKAYAS
jgi:hypothetical protein